jgi:hypothetical protein
MHPRRALPLVVCLLAAPACLVEGPHSRDQHRTVDIIRQEHRWAADQIGRRVTEEDLARVRSGELQASRAARVKFVRLVDGIDRATWIREATPRGIWASAYDPPDMDELAFRFERAGLLRRQAMAEADELADALVDSAVPGAISFSELRKAMLAANRADASEAHLVAELTALVNKEPTLQPALRRFVIQQPTKQRPFVPAVTTYLRNHPSERAELERLPAELSGDAQLIEKALAEQPAPPPRAAQPKPQPPPPPEPAKKPVPQEPTPDEKAAVRERGQAQQEELSDEAGKSDGSQLEIQGDAREMMTARGLPRSMGHKNGLLVLRYAEQRPCKTGSCEALVDYFFDADGSFKKEEVVGGARAPTRPPPPPPAKKGQDDEFKGDD